MSGKLYGLVCAALIAGSVGCGMCQAPYDYCAPTIAPDGKPTGGFMTRKGSVLGGMPGVPMFQSQPTLASPTAAAAGRADGASAPQGEQGAPIQSEGPVDIQ